MVGNHKKKHLQTLIRTFLGAPEYTSMNRLKEEWRSFAIQSSESEKEVFVELVKERCGKNRTAIDLLSLGRAEGKCCRGKCESKFLHIYHHGQNSFEEEITPMTGKQALKITAQYILLIVSYLVAGVLIVL